MKNWFVLALVSCRCRDSKVDDSSGADGLRSVFWMTDADFGGAVQISGGGGGGEGKWPPSSSLQVKSDIKGPHEGRFRMERCL
jgi:hypothetical protein